MVKSKKIIITGSSRGIGLELVKYFSSKGCEVVANSRNIVELKNSIKGLDNIIPIEADLSSASQAKNFIEDSFKKLGGLDLLICNAGGGKSVEPGQEDLMEWKRVFELNLWPTTNAVEFSVPYLENSGGSIICISSICGIQVVNGAPVTYSSAKAALNAFVKGISRPLGAKGVRINAVAPGNIIFEGSSWEGKISQDPDKVESLLNNEVTLKRFGTPKEVADLINFISSSEASFITGSIYTLDGGQVR
jgi:NAD(P)-dependent dehydrogenase (short-subunit alcohol dehydrogenase family)